MHHKLCLSYILLVWNKLSNECAGCCLEGAKVVELSFESTRDLVGVGCFAYNIFHFGKFMVYAWSSGGGVEV